MNLIVDLGNTSLKWALFDGKNLIFKGNFDYSDFNVIINHWTQFKFERIAVATVIDLPPTLKSFFDSFESVHYVSTNSKLPIKVGYQTPNTLGYDRLANAVAAIELFQNKDLLVIDCGTCLKVDFVSRTDGFLGGAISPGLKMRYKSLHQYTSKLPLLDPAVLRGLYGKTTEESLHNGVVNGMSFEIAGATEKYVQSYPDLKVIITGGDIDYFREVIEKKAIFAEPNLTLIGINLILLYN